MYLISLISLVVLGSLQNIQCSIAGSGYAEEGFCHGTLVKVAGGCKLIENLKVGDFVLDADGREIPILAVAKRAVDEYMNITVGETVIHAGKDQRFLVLRQDFFTARNLSLDHVLLDAAGRHHYIDQIELMQDQETLYVLTVEGSIFCIDDVALLAHNAEAMVLGVSSMCLGYITAVNPVIIMVGVGIALGEVAYRAYTAYISNPSHSMEVSHDAMSTHQLPTDVILAERYYYEKRKKCLESLKQEFLKVNGGLETLQLLCYPGSQSFTYTFLQQSIMPKYTPKFSFRFTMAEEMVLDEAQKNNLRNYREAVLTILEEEICDIQLTLAVHSNELIEQFYNALKEYGDEASALIATTKLWNENLKTISNQDALRAYEMDLLEESLIHDIDQKLQELKLVAQYYSSCMNIMCIKKSTNIIEALEGLKQTIFQYEQWVAHKKQRVSQNITIVEELLTQRGVSIAAFKNETKNTLGNRQKNRKAKALAEATEKKSNMRGSGGPKKDADEQQDAQAPGMPTEKDGYKPPKNWDGKKVRHPKNGKVGWPDDKGNIWVPTGPGSQAHGGPHWDVQHPNGRTYDNVYPGGKIRVGNK